MAQEKMILPHTLTLTDRRQLSMTGVTEVVSFDESAVLLRTEQGDLLIEGRDLQLKSLLPDSGQILVDGTVSALSYQQPRQSGWLNRMFK